VRRWNLLIALGVLLGLSAYVYFVEIKGGEKRQKEKEEAEKVLPFKTEQVMSMILTHGSERIRLEKVVGKWKIQEPLQTAPDNDAVDRLLNSLQEMRISHDLGKSSDLASYNLKTPPASVELSLQSAPKPLRVLHVGDDAPTGGGAYARLGEDGKILIVSGTEALKGATLFSLRDKTYFKFDPGKLSRVKLATGEDEVSLVKRDGQWSLEIPVAAAAEDSTVADFIYALERLTVTEFVDDKPAPDSLKKRGLGPARYRVTLHGEEWKSDPQLQFGETDSGSLYTIRPASGALVKVSDSIEAKLKSTVTDLRKKDLLPWARWDMAKFRITGALPATLELKRSGDQEWDRVSPSPGVLPDDPVDLLLRNLTDLKAAEFLDRPSAKTGSYGLEQPAAKLEFWKKGQAGTAPRVLRVGKSDGHGKVYLKDEKWPSVILVQEESWKKAVEQARKVEDQKPKAKTAPGASSTAQTAPATP